MPETVDAPPPAQGDSAVGVAAAGTPSPPPPEQLDSIDAKPATENVRIARKFLFTVRPVGKLNE